MLVPMEVWCLSSLSPQRSRVVALDDGSDDLVGRWNVGAVVGAAVVTVAPGYEYDAAGENDLVLLLGADDDGEDCVRACDVAEIDGGYAIGDYVRLGSRSLCMRLRPGRRQCYRVALEVSLSVSQQLQPLPRSPKPGRARTTRMRKWRNPLLPDTVAACLLLSTPARANSAPSDGGPQPVSAAAPSPFVVDSPLLRSS